jgi:hypothetical protein
MQWVLVVVRLGDFVVLGAFMMPVPGFSILTYRLRALLDRLLPLDLDQRNRISPNLDQTFEVVS